MSDAVVRLEELADPMAFLTGARIPLAHLWPMPFPAVEWIATRILIEGSTGPRFDTIRRETTLMLGLDCSHPDVARWCDRKIATALGSDRPDRLFLYAQIGGFGVGKGWAIGSTSWTRDGECDESSRGNGVPDAPLLFDVICDDAHLPTARAAILRALFGVSNA